MNSFYNLKKNVYFKMLNITLAVKNNKIKIKILFYYNCWTICKE